MLFLKSIVYRMFASSVTVLIAYVMTGNLIISSGIGILEFISKIFSYYLFERIWDKITKSVHARSYRCKCFRFNKSGTVILVSGLNCAGKTTIAKELAKNIDNCVLLDGDSVRKNVNCDLGFSDNDIRQNLTRVCGIANILNDQGYNVIISCISRKRNDRAYMREILNTDDYHEVFVNCDKDELERRQRILHPDTKVIQKNYERSDYDVIEVDSSKQSVESCAGDILCSIFQD